MFSTSSFSCIRNKHNLTIIHQVGDAYYQITKDLMSSLEGEKTKAIQENGNEVTLLFWSEKSKMMN